VNGPSGPLEPDPAQPGPANEPEPVILGGTASDERAAPESRASEHPSPMIPSPAVASTRRLLGASFDLLTRASDDMRRASFYIGVIVLGTVGPLALASFAFEVVSVHMTKAESSAVMLRGGTAWVGMLGMLAGVGLLVAAVESRAMAAAILGGRLATRPVTVRAAVARSRMVFWRVIVASMIVGVPVLIAQTAVSAVFVAVLGSQTDVSLVSSTLVAALVGAPLAYLLGGVVLGDVEPFEAARRSFRVFRARKMAAVLVAVFETIAVLLVYLGLGAGLDIAFRVFDALGLGVDSGPAGLALVTIGIVAGVFALGTLLYTALALSVAPQMVMFVGLTQATFGLDHVRPGGDRDPAVPLPGQRRFRWLTITMLVAFVAGVLLLAGLLALFTR